MGNLSQDGTITPFCPSRNLTLSSDLLIRHSSLHGGEEQRREILGGNNKQRTRVACLACAAAKLRCSETRPCERCTLRGITCDKPTSSPNIEEHDSSPELSGANARLLVETSNHEAYKDQPEQQHSVFGDPHIEPTALQPGQSSGSDVFDSHVAQPVHMSQIPGEMAVHSGTSKYTRAGLALVNYLQILSCIIKLQTRSSA